MNKAAAGVLVLVLCASVLPAQGQPEQGLVCVAPDQPWQVDEKGNEWWADPRFSCAGGRSAVRIDGGPAVTLSRTESVLMPPLDIAKRHKVVFLCNGKAKQAFWFRFSEFRTRRLCVFLNDMYGWAQINDDKNCLLV